MHRAVKIARTTRAICGWKFAGERLHITYRETSHQLKLSQQQTRLHLPHGLDVGAMCTALERPAQAAFVKHNHSTQFTKAMNSNAEAPGV